MTFSGFRGSPLVVMFAAALLVAAMSLVSVLTALSAPQLPLPAGAVPTAVGAVTLTEVDRMPEPDHLGSYPKLRAFFDRQTQIAGHLDGDQVTVRYTMPDGSSASQTVTPRARAISDLPFPFWYQQIVGIVAVMMAGWVLSLRSGDWGARMFALTGVFLAGSAMAAAVYSTRQIALPGDMFRTLSSINHASSALFGIALVGLFMMYPRPLVRPIWLLLPAGIYSIGIVLELLYVGQGLWVNLIISSQLLITIVLGVVQWIRTKDSQMDRAGLRWFFLFSIIGCCLFVVLSVLPPVLGLAEQGYVSQAYAFGFFNLMQLGLALGVVRWRVFDLDRYAYFIWLWLVGIFLIFATDLLLLLWLSDQPLTSLGIALVIASFVYFPVRQFLLTRLFSSKTPRPSEMITQVFEAAVAPTQRLQNTRWDALLKETFATAGDAKPLAGAPDTATISQNGLALDIPPTAGMQGRQLLYPNGGKRLFNSADQDAANVLCRMYEVARNSHEAYDRGVTVERDRISRDVHDNIGAQLLSALHTSEAAGKDTVLRETLTDLRQIISDGFSSQFDVTDVAADLRVEMADRLEMHNITLRWLPQADTGGTPLKLPYQAVNNLRSILRELTSNVIKHGDASEVRVDLTTSGQAVQVDVRDNGTPYDPATVARGAGLNSIASRVEMMGGTLDQSAPQNGGNATRFSLPLQANPAP